MNTLFIYFMGWLGGMMGTSSADLMMRQKIEWKRNIIISLILSLIVSTIVVLTY